MKEYNIDLVIDKTFNIFADSLEEAKEKAIMNARQLMDSYNSLSIDRIEVVEELTWDHEYDVKIITAKGNEYNYDIDADDIHSAEMVAREFFADDYPDEMIQTIEVHLVEEENE
jgi:hypothetical protein